jgi:hypothetical protein
VLPNNVRWAVVETPDILSGLGVPPGGEREELVCKARQVETAVHVG